MKKFTVDFVNRKTGEVVESLKLKSNKKER